MSSLPPTGFYRLSASINSSSSHPACSLISKACADFGLQEHATIRRWKARSTHCSFPGPPDKVQLSPTLLRWFRSRARNAVGRLNLHRRLCHGPSGSARWQARSHEEVRLEAVRRKLENSTRSLEEIAAACGFNSADVLSRSFQRHLKTTPAEYRARFRTSGAQHHESVRRQPRQR